MKVFLGGTCNGSRWRNDLIKNLKIDYFNPVVEDWNEKAQKRELKEREECDYCLYVITPQQTGVYAIAEIADDSNKRPEKTIFCFLEKYGFDKFLPSQIKSLEQVGKLVNSNGATWLKDLNEVSTYLNERA